MEINKAVLYILSGLPGTGKSTLAKTFSEKMNAVYLRIDTIEQEIRDLCNFNVGGEGYRLTYRIIEDNLKVGNNVISDQVNPVNFIRKEFNNLAVKNNCKYMNIEIICSDEKEHKYRIENRINEIENLKLPTWEEIKNRNYERWEEEHIIIDTAKKTINECINELMDKINIKIK